MKISFIYLASSVLTLVVNGQHLFCKTLEELSDGLEENLSQSNQESASAQINKDFNEITSQNFTDQQNSTVVQRIRGQKGERGLRGPKGPSGSRGEKGAMGMKGEAGEKGDTGEPGARGKRGPPGKAPDDSMDDVVELKKYVATLTSTVNDLEAKVRGFESQQQHQIFIYKKTPQLSFADARKYCKVMGGEIAHTDIKTKNGKSTDAFTSSALPAFHLTILVGMLEF